MVKLKKAALAIIVVLALLCIAGAILLLQPKHAPGVNLIANPSFEEEAAGQPKAWSKSAWGTNEPAFAYVANDARSGSKSVKVSMERYTDGDAKWSAASIVLEAGKQYEYSDYYKATAATDVLVQFEDISGALSYLKLSTASVANDWKQVRATFTAPANLKGAIVIHALKAVGTLQIDDTYLAQTHAIVQANQTPNVNLVPNPSAETAAADAPTDWQATAWNVNKYSHTYAQEGYTGVRSLKVEVAGVNTDGSAHWTFPAQKVTPGAQYQYGDYFKATMQTEIFAVYTLADGSVKYQYLGEAQPTPDWLHYWHTFTVPENATTATITHVAKSDGALQIDDVTFGPFQEVGFDRAVVSLTFDDAWRSVYTNALPVMNKYGLRSTQYLLSGTATDPGYMTVDMMKEFKNRGHEIASHTIDHHDLTKVSNTDLRSQLTQPKKWFASNIGVMPVNFATPYGAYNSDVVGIAKEQYRSHRSVESGYNGKDNFDIYNIRVQNITNTTSPAEVAAWVAKAKATKTWLVIVYHQVEQNPGEVGTTPQGFESQMATVKAMGVPVLTVNEALDELVPQLK